MADGFDWNNFEDAPGEEAVKKAEPVKAPAANFDWNAHADVNDETGDIVAKAAISPISLGYGAAKTGLSAFQRLLKGEDQDILGDLKENTQQGNDFMAGGVQGALLGGTDELTGVANAVGGKILGRDESMGELYREGQQKADAQFDKSKARNPVAYGGGELTGAVAAGVATGGLGLESALAKKMASVGIKNAAQLGKMKLAGEVGKQVLAAGAEGAVAGGIQGGLSSKDNLDNALDLGKDIVSGATFGGIASGAIKGASSVLPSVQATAKDVVKAPVDWAAKKSGSIDQAGMVWDRVRKGLPVDYNDLRLAGELEGIENEVLNKFYSARKNIGDRLGKAYAAAERQGVMVNLDDPLSQAASGFQAYATHTPAANIQAKPEYKKLLEKIFLIKNPNLTPTQAKILSDEIGELSGKLKDPQISKIAGEFSQGVDNALGKAVPDSKLLNDQFYKVNKFGLETVAGKGKVNPVDVAGFNKLDKVEERGGIQWLLGAITNPNSPKEDVTRAMHYMKKNLTELENANYP